MTCRRWVTQAGIDVKLAQRARRTEYFRLRADAVPQQEAAQRVGLNIRTAVDRDQGIRHANNRRVRPDGRIIDYNTSVTALSDSHIRLTPAQLKPIASRYLSLVDREAIRDLSGTGMSIRSIAMTLRRAPSTISREIIRNSQDDLSYLPDAAQRAAAGRRPRPREAKLVQQGSLREFVQEKLRSAGLLNRYATPWSRNSRPTKPCGWCPRRSIRPFMFRLGEVSDVKSTTRCALAERAESPERPTRHAGRDSVIRW